MYPDSSEDVFAVVQPAPAFRKPCIALGVVDDLIDAKGKVCTCIHGKTLLRKTWRRLLGMQKEEAPGVNVVPI
jgi:hypothetical protein